MAYLLINISAASKGCREEPSMSVTTSGAATNMMTVFYYISLKKMYYYS